MKKLVLALILCCSFGIYTFVIKDSNHDKIQPPTLADEVSKIYVETPEQVVHALERGSTHSTSEKFTEFLEGYHNGNVKIDGYRVLQGATCSEVTVSFYVKGDSHCYSHAFVTKA